MILRNHPEQNSLTSQLHQLWRVLELGSSK